MIIDFLRYILIGQWMDNRVPEIRPSEDQCVMDGAMYCSHRDWCEVEKIMFPEQYAEEISKKNSKDNFDD